MKMRSIALIFGMAFAVPFAGLSDVRPSALFTDNMVIQRETSAPVWGWADAGEKVTVTGSWGETAATTADASGKWMVKLKTPAAGGPYTITIKGNNTVEIKNVLSGEVWLCSGQSNMDFTMNKLTNINARRTEKRYEPVAAYVKQEMETAQDEMLRQFFVLKNTSPLEPVETLRGKWVASSPQNNPDFSATAYFFARELRKELNVPVGLIMCAWGGTRVEAWIPAEAFRKDEEMAAYYEKNMAEMEEKMSKWDPAKVNADYQAALQKWKAAKKGRRPGKQGHPTKNPQLPSTLFNAMVNPVIPYAISGAIWYQGESNAGHNTPRYEYNFRTMISAWRDQWGQGDFPFYFAQLASYQDPSLEPAEYDGWPSVCDQQRRTLGLKNTGMAVLNDIGEAEDVHPHNKIDVGRRLALWALKNDYNQPIPACSGPLYSSHEIKDGNVVIHFDHAGSGLMSGEKPVMEATRETEAPLKHFQICGADRQWKWARAEITGKDTVTVSHPEVPEPVVVRYAWAPNPEGANLYNKEGLPASVFTTEAEIPAAIAPQDAIAPSESQSVGANGMTLFAEGSTRAYEIWEPEPAPNNGRSKWEGTKSSGSPNSYDRDWERWSYPIGNGYVGASVFGRTDTERVQVTDKTVHNKGLYGSGGLTSFAEIYLDFMQDDVRNYRRSLNLNEAIAHVSYEKNGVTYQREYFASYPDNVIVIRLTADQKGALSFKVRTEIPYLEMNDRTGLITAAGNQLTLKGTVPFFNCNFEGQIKVLNEGGSVTADAEAGTIEVSGADAVTLLIATGSNYKLSPDIFSNPPAEKLDPNLFPHDEVSARIQAAQDMGYAVLRERHLEDYQNLFDRVSVNLNSTPSTDPTHLLLEKYKAGETNTWLEELMFQYGRYLLIASSREKSLPANLQGTWSQYYHTPWTGGYWHNINVQMNYWGAMSANLSECFDAYISFYKAYLPQAKQHAADYVRKYNPDRLTEGGDNGWIIGTGANAYTIPGAEVGHSGPGIGGFTAKLLVDYYLFTQDRRFLEEVAYPAMLSLSRFYSKALIPHGDLLLVEPSASPEQRATPEQLERMPNHPKGRHYVTAGCTFDQGFVWETFSDTLALANMLGKTDPFLETIREQITRLDPILVGADGQIKEYREETHYSDIGDPKHRHISHLSPLYPGSLINSGHGDWMRAASKTLDLRGNGTTGWALAHRMNCRARLGEGDKAHEVYQRFISERTVPNLWTLHPPFQIDGNLGTMAAVAEMLLQSHGEYIRILPALPAAWKTGSFDGLVARGNFVISAEWMDGKATAISIRSRSGGECRIAYPDIGSATVMDGEGNPVESYREGDDLIRFTSAIDDTYTFLINNGN